MGDENPIRTLGDYSKPSHEGYRNTIELPVGNNVDFLKLVDSLDLDGENRERTRLRLFQFSPRNQASNWLERLPAGSISTCGPHDTRHCMENPEQAFVEYASSRIDEAGEGLVSEFMASQDARLSKFKADFKQQQSEMNNKIDTVLKAITDRIAAILPKDDGEVMFIEIIRDNDEPQNKDPNEGEGETTEELVVEYFDTFPTRDELTYHRGNTNRGISNFTGRIKEMHVFVGNFTYVIDFMIIEDISSILDPRLSQVILGRPFVEISNMTHDPPERVVRFVRGADNVSYKMPHKIEQYDSLSDLEKEHTKLVYLGNEEDKR
ncbi:hypothetical protein Tco_1508949 [Tanacetum coccineum]